MNLYLVLCPLNFDGDDLTRGNAKTIWLSGLKAIGMCAAFTTEKDARAFALDYYDIIEIELVHPVAES